MREPAVDVLDLLIRLTTILAVGLVIGGVIAILIVMREQRGK